jgi:hypothetical protein
VTLAKAVSRQNLVNTQKGYLSRPSSSSSFLSLVFSNIQHLSQASPLRETPFVELLQKPTLLVLPMLPFPSQEADGPAVQRAIQLLSVP